MDHCLHSSGPIQEDPKASLKMVLPNQRLGLSPRPGKDGTGFSVVPGVKGTYHLQSILDYKAFHKDTIYFHKL